MKNLFLKLGIFSIGLVLMFLVVDKFVMAADVVEQKVKYKIHEQIPGQGGEEGIDTLQGYLEAVYKFGIAIVAILAVVMIGVGGFMYIVTSAGNAGKLADAKEIITSAIFGLVMALLAWLILFVINPDLVGNTLDSVKLDIGSKDIDKIDEELDPILCKEASLITESKLCHGNSFCLEGKCIRKDSICLLKGSPKIEGVCHEDDFVKDVGENCGKMVNNNEDKWTGICTGNYECSGTASPITEGRMCLTGACCTVGL
jgi:hypothetical protein